MELLYPTSRVTHSASVLDVVGREAVSGRLLMQRGMQLPIVHPESVLVFRLSVD